MSARRSHKKITAAVGGAVLLTGTLTGVAIASSGTDDENDKPIPANDLATAEQAALAEIGSGTVTETEVGDEESLYEVEVTLDDGTQVDVQLDENFVVVGTETDHEDTGSDDAGEG